MTDFYIQRRIGKYNVGDIARDQDSQTDYWISQVAAGNAVSVSGEPAMDASEDRMPRPYLDADGRREIALTPFRAELGVPGDAHDSFASDEEE